MRITPWVGGAVVSLVLLSWSASSAGERECRRPVLPSNVEFLFDLERVVQRIHEGSPTFRAQCERIGRASNLKVRVFINVRIPKMCRALTVIYRQGFEIRADVHLPPGTDYSELIGHEFEHVIEQIEGLNLRKLSKVRGSGVRAVERELFESTRAQEAGRVVASEYYRHMARSTD